jgi:hypothetical protein
MPQPKIHASAAQRQAAYRFRRTLERHQAGLVGTIALRNVTGGQA